MPKQVSAAVARPAARGEATPLAARAWQGQVVERVFPLLVEGVRRGESAKRKKTRRANGDDAAERLRDGALGWLERLLLLFFADARGRLPAGGGRARGATLGRLRSELARLGGGRFEDVERNLSAAYRDGQSQIGDRVLRLLGPLERIFLSETVSAPDDSLARAIDALSRIWLDRSGKPQKIDYRRLTTRDWGAAYERLLEVRLDPLAPANPEPRGKRQPPSKDKARRKTGGCFYTPALIVADIVEHAVGAALDARLAALSARRAGPDAESRRRSTRPAAAGDSHQAWFDFRVLDPSSGAGYFLDEARRAIARRVAAFLNNPSGRSGARRPALQGDAADDGSAQDWIERQLVERCLFAIDVDPRAVELTRMHLWLQSPLEIDSIDALCRNIRLGDALAEPRLPDFPGAGQFDVVVGNPPYGGRLDAETRRALARKLPLMKSNADTAAGFVERAAQWVRPEGRVGFVVPKPLTYSYAWRGARDFLRRRVERLIDVSRAWPEVRLEQAIVVFRGAPSSDFYCAGWLSEGRIAARRRMSWELADRFRTLPCALEPAEFERLAQLEFADVSLGDVCRTFRGIPAQSRLVRRGDTPVIGGRDLARWRIRGASGYLNSPANFDLLPFAREKLVFQNIIAHVARPQPHVKLIGAYDERGTVALDTVNNLVATDPRVDLRGLCALLHSRLVNWIVYSLVYNKAIRTMHFDQYFLDKIPLPPQWPALLERLSLPARECEIAAEAPSEIARGLEPSTAVELELRRRQALEQIERLVAAAYGDAACGDADYGDAACGDEFQS